MRIINNYIIKIVIASLVIAFSAYTINQNIGINRNNFLSSDETGVFSTTLNFELNKQNLRLEGEQYHPFFGFYIQNFLLQITNMDYQLLELSNYIMFTIIVFILILISKTLTKKYIWGILGTLFLLTNEIFINQFFLTFRFFFQINTILTLITILFLIKYLKTKNIDYMNLFLLFSFLNIITMETGMLHFATCIIILIIFKMQEQKTFNIKKILNGLSKEINDNENNNDIIPKIILLLLISLILITISILIISRTNMGENIFEGGDQPSIKLILTIFILIIINLIYNKENAKKKKEKNIINLISLLALTQLVVFLIVSYFADFPKRAFLYIIPIAYISITLELSLLLKNIVHINKPNKLKELMILITTLIISIILIVSIFSDQINNIEQIRENLRVEKERVQDLEEALNIKSLSIMNKINQTNQTDSNLVYSLAFRQLQTIDYYDKFSDFRNIKIEIEYNNEDIEIIFRESYIEARVELYNLEEFNIIIQKSLYDRFWKRLDQNITCTEIRESKYHITLKCER